MSKRSKYFIIFVIIFGIVYSIIHWGSRFGNPTTNQTFHQGPIIPARDISSFHLTDHLGQPFGLERLKGAWSMIFIGYTMCPDVCPMSLGYMSESLEKMEKEPQGLQGFRGIFVSVDVKRDTPDKLKDYVGYFHPSFVGLTGTKDEIDNFIRQLGAAYIIHSPQDPKDPETYHVTHSSSIYFVSPDGRLIDMVIEPKNADEIVQKSRALRGGRG
ncbi:MAG: SCO family protein [Magnetococcales bacterium]|nr:SCO family protein [Magnetococcales bacterium]